MFGWDGVVESHGPSPFYRPCGLALCLRLSAHLRRHVFRLSHVSRSGIINPSFHRRSQLYSIHLMANQLEEFGTRFAQFCLLHSVKKLFCEKKNTVRFNRSLFQSIVSFSYEWPVGKTAISVLSKIMKSFKKKCPKMTLLNPYRYFSGY